jgi:Ca-activated chloride channel family protein
VLLSDGETTVGRETAEGAEVAAAANVPVFTIAFGTADGSITDPVSGETIPVPVQPGPLADVAETTGGTAYEAATATELSDAYDRIQDALGATLGEEVETVTELTWRWAAAAIALLAAAWALGLWWLRGMV